MSALAFRNVDASPDDPVSEWPQEAIQAALERGGISHWRRLAKEIQAAPWGPVARRVEEVLSYSRPYGVADAIGRVIGMAREETEKSERETVAAEIDGLVRESGLSRTEFASRIGTSASRLSTYVTGRVTPSAALLVRMRHVAQHEHASRELQAMSPPQGDGREPNWEDQKQESRDARLSRRRGA